MNKDQSTLPNILIVDDIEENLIFMEGALATLNVNIIKAMSGMDALNLTENTNLALAIIDVRMPIMNGYELAKKLNETRIDEKVPIIFITANNYLEMEVLKAYSSGAIDYIFKPVSVNIIKSKVKVFIDLFHQKQTIIDYAAVLEKSAEKLEKEKNRAEEIAERFSKVTKIGGSFVWETDKNGALIYISDSFESVTGYKKVLVLGKLLDEKFIPPNLKKILEQKSTIKSGLFNQIDLHNIEHEIIKKNGEKLVLMINAELYFCNNNIFAGIKGICTDITKLKIIESKLRESQFELSRLNANMTNILEQQSLHISYSLHDVIGHQIALVRFNSFYLKSLIDKTDKQKIELIKQIIKDTDELMNQVRSLSKHMKGDIVYELGLIPGLEILITSLTEKTRLNVIFNAKKIEAKLEKIVELHIYRIIQEIFTNIIKHSKAKNIEVKITQNKDKLYFCVIDDGIGFNINDVEKNNTLGLIGIRERIKTIKGNIEIESDFGKGTKYIFSVAK